MNIKSKRSNVDSSIESVNLTLCQPHLSFWRNSPPRAAADITLSVSNQCIEELEAALSRTGDAELPDTTDASRFRHCIDFANQLRSVISHEGCGLAIVDRLPAENFNEMDNKRMCAMMASLLGPLMAQNHEGVTLYDVKNTNPKNPENVRKSITNFAQPYHTDGGWHRVPAKYVGLYCIRSAQNGGSSRVTSIMNAYSLMLEKHPNQLETLLLAAPWDRQGEHATEEEKTQMNPMFEAHCGLFLSRYYESYIRNGIKKSGLQLPAKLDDALNCIQHVVDHQPSAQFEMKSGQFQYLNNWTMLHARGGFKDDNSTPEHLRRHVIRVWNS